VNYTWFYSLFAGWHIINVTEELANEMNSARISGAKTLNGYNISNEYNGNGQLKAWVLYGGLNTTAWNYGNSEAWNIEMTNAGVYNGSTFRWVGAPRVNVSGNQKYGGAMTMSIYVLVERD
jgi:hypothetical protein